MNKSHLLNTLEQVFGFNQFRSGQDEIIQSIIGGTDTLAVMPTGGGKSLCYQLPALCLKGTAIVVSPLIALMKDQVDSLTKLGIPATFLNSSIPQNEYDTRLYRASENAYKLIYIAPERFDNSQFLTFMNRLQVSFLAIDEAHCISEWGHDFRPAYLNISKIFDAIERVPIIALTATATKEVQDDIVKSLKLQNANRFIKGFNRENLSYICNFSEDKQKSLSDILQIIEKKEKGSTIIYCGSRKRVEAFSESLRSDGFSPIFYHGGISDERRTNIQNMFINSQNPIIVATNAFGMGIDKANVRNVIHLDLTQTLEAYYQEAGRAGRDGKPSKCTMLYNPSDRKLQEFFINTTFPDKVTIGKVYNTLYDINNTKLGEKPFSPIVLHDIAIANNAKVPLFALQSVIGLLEKNNIVFRTTKSLSAKIRFEVPRERASEYYNSLDGEKALVFEAILRCIPYESFSQDTEINLANLGYKYNLSSDIIEKYMQQFITARIITFSPKGVDKGMMLIAERMPSERIPIDFDKLQQRRERALSKLNIMQNFAETNECKRNYILKYFGETDFKGNCGKCSSCNGTNTNLKFSTKDSYLLKNILKTIAMLSNKFTQSTIVNVVLGKDNNKVVPAFHLDTIATWASCKEFNEIKVREEFKKAVFLGFIIINPDQFQTVGISQKGIDFLGYTPKRFISEKFQAKKTNSKLYQDLLNARDEIASIERLVPRAIASDRAIKKIADDEPLDVFELESLNALSNSIFYKYGQEFINIIKKNNFSFDDETPNIPDTVIKTVELFNINQSIAETSRIRKLSDATISKHLDNALSLGIEIKSDIFKSYHNYQLIKEIIKHKPNVSLRELRDESNEEIDFNELRVIRAIINFELGK